MNFIMKPVSKFIIVPGGTVTTPAGFRAGATFAGVNKKSKFGADLGILISEVPSVAAGMFTTNRVKSAPVVISRERVQKGRIIGIVANSGCANASTGEQGMADAREMSALAAKAVGAAPEDMLVASTGVIGQFLPMKQVEAGISQVVLTREGGHELARAIMTTDTVPKEIAITVKTGDGDFTIGGIAKGSGMIHPNMGTMFCFLATDAVVELEFLKAALKRSVDDTFNMISVDGDTSPSDTVVLMANGLAANKPFAAESRHAATFQQALDDVCTYLAKSIVADGEGATRLIEVNISGARSEADARLAARTVVTSPLVKTAVHGADPNWGRIMAALGRSGAEMEEEKVDLYIGAVGVLKKGRPLPYNEQKVVKAIEQKEVEISVNLNLGESAATAWGCDLSKEYVNINSQYMT